MHSCNERAPHHPSARWDSPKRREFLAMIAGLGAASPFVAGLLKAQQAPAPNPVRQEWLDLHKEPVLEPSLPIIDPHHHLWVRGTWRYLIDELLVDTRSGHNIVATVFVTGAFHGARQRACGNASRG